MCRKERLPCRFGDELSEMAGACYIIIGFRSTPYAVYRVMWLREIRRKEPTSPLFVGV